MNSAKEDTRRTTIVLPQSIDEALHELCLYYHLSRSSVISLLVDQEMERKRHEITKLREKRSKGYCEIID
jgi:hypothetical protein